MNLLILASYVLGNISLEGSPYFYDDELDKKCMGKIVESFRELCHPFNCVVSNTTCEESLKPVVFVGFQGVIRGNHYIFTKGKERIIYKDHREKRESEYWQVFVKEIVSKILKKIKKKYNLQYFDIYFTVNPSYNETEYFNKDNLKETIDSITKIFKKEMKDKISKKKMKDKLSKKEVEDEPLVQYFPNDYQIYENNKRRVYHRGTEGLKLVDEEIEYLVFFKESFNKKLTEDLKSLVKSHEEKIRSELKTKFKVESEVPRGLAVLAILYRINGDLKDDLSTSQTNFLLKIWKFLKHKEGFNDSFLELFESGISDVDKRELEESLNAIILENKKLFKREGYYNLYLNNKGFPQSEKYYLLMSWLRSRYSEPPSENTRKLIRKIFSILSKNYESLASIILSEDIEGERIHYIIYNIEEYTFSSYDDCLKKMILNYIKYLETDEPSERNEVFEYWKKECLEAISLMNNEDSIILGTNHKELFEEFIKQRG